jgi:asparagine synthase (glutamine-hydrolysing)
MPIWNDERNYLIIFAGDYFVDSIIYNEQKAKHGGIQLDKANYLIWLYEEHGDDFIKMLNGWFSGVLIDLRSKKIILFNDRYGQGRIYYYEDKKGFYFASEAKALLSVFPHLRQLDLATVGEMLSFGCVMQNKTLFPGIRLLPGGSKWTFRKPYALKKESYFDPSEWENQEILDNETYYEKLKTTFTTILPQYLQSNEKIGMSLTGGLDARMIMAWAKLKPGELPCYTFGGTYRDCRDVRIARQVAALCGQTHETILAGTELIRNFPALAEKCIYVSDGTMDVSGAVELFINSLARGIAPVRLTGTYGSEIVRGNIAFKPHAPCLNLFTPDIQRFIQSAAETYCMEANCNRMTFIAFKQVPWHHYPRLSLEQSQLTLRSPYLDNDLVSMMYQAPLDLLINKTPSLRLIAEGDARLARLPTDKGLLYKPIPVVTQLQHSYHEFTTKAEYAYDYGMPQWLAFIDHFFKFMHFEHLFLGRHKFYHLRVWYRDMLSEYVKDILLDHKTLNRPYLNKKIVEDIVKAHTRGNRNYTTEITQLLTLELIQRLLIEQ